MSPIYRTTYQVEVLSDGPLVLHGHGGDNDPFDLLAINYEITYGHCVGKVIEVNSEALADDVVADALKAVGNDGEFFDDALYPEDNDL